MFCQFGPVARCQYPLCKIVGESLSKEVVMAESLKGVIENGGVAANLQTLL
jgi:hypothetical protein